MTDIQKEDTKKEDTNIVECVKKEIKKRISYDCFNILIRNDNIVDNKYFMGINNIITYLDYENNNSININFQLEILDRCYNNNILLFLTADNELYYFNIKALTAYKKTIKVINAKIFQFKPLIFPIDIKSMLASTCKFAMTIYNNDIVIVIEDYVFIFNTKLFTLTDISYNKAYEQKQITLNPEEQYLFINYFYSNFINMFNVSTLDKTYQCKQFKILDNKIKKSIQFSFYINSRCNKLITIDNENKIKITNLEQHINIDSCNIESRDIDKLWEYIDIPYEDPIKEFPISTTIYDGQIYIATYKNIYYCNLEDYNSTPDKWIKMDVYDVKDIMQTISDKYEPKFLYTLKQKKKLDSSDSSNDDHNDDDIYDIYDDNIPIMWSGVKSCVYNKNSLFAISFDYAIHKIVFNEKTKLMCLVRTYIGADTSINHTQKFLSQFTILDKYIIDVKEM